MEIGKLLKRKAFGTSVVWRLCFGYLTFGRKRVACTAACVLKERGHKDELYKQMFWFFFIFHLPNRMKDLTCRMKTQTLYVLEVVL